MAIPAQGSPRRHHDACSATAVLLHGQDLAQVNRQSAAVRARPEKEVRPGLILAGGHPSVVQHVQRAAVPVAFALDQGEGGRRGRIVDGRDRHPPEFHGGGIGEVFHRYVHFRPRRTGAKRDAEPQDAVGPREAAKCSNDHWNRDRQGRRYDPVAEMHSEPGLK